MSPILSLPQTKPDTRIWSPQQEEIFREIRAGTSNIIIEAVAGSGKTTTLVKACELMQGSVAFCAYNKAIADEIKVRVASLLNIQPGTFHSFGFSAWKNAAGSRIKVDPRKLDVLADDLNIPWGARKFVKSLVGFTKQGIVRPGQDFHEHARSIVEFRELEDQLSGCNVDQGIAFAELLLNQSIKVSDEIIDFDDMMYMPLLTDCKFPQFDWVLVDEAQDTNLARRLISEKMLKPSGRYIAVGDRHQAIYGFTGADSDSMDLIKRKFGCIELPLTVTYRCATEIVNHARQIVNHITARADAPKGTVSTLQNFDFLKPLYLKSLKREDAILCRNTRPLVSLAFELIRQDVGCHVEGREIGQGLINVAKKNANDWTPVHEVRDNIQDYMDREVTKWLKKNQEAKASQVEDQCETLFVILSNMKETDTLASVIRKIQSLFGDTEPGKPSPSLTLCTIHKSKGREWNKVIFYGRNAYCPSKYARQPWQLEQERNLEYVAITRAKLELIEIEL